MTVAVDRLEPAELGAASRLLARAFSADPIITHFLSDPARREAALPAFFAAVLEVALPAHQTYAARDGSDLLGVAAWFSPSGSDIDATAQERAEDHERLVRVLFPSSADALFSGFAELEKFHPQEPHWYLPFVGLEDGYRGKGIGRLLLEPVLTAADEGGTICYLETPFSQTHAFYESLGFRRHAEHWCFDGVTSSVVTFVRPA